MRSPTFWCRVEASRSLLGSVEEEAEISGTWELLKTEDQLFTPVNREGLLLRREVTGFLVVCNFCWPNIFSIQASWRRWHLSHRLNKILQEQKKITLNNDNLWGLQLDSTAIIINTCFDYQNNHSLAKQQEQNTMTNNSLLTKSNLNHTGWFAKNCPSPMLSISSWMLSSSFWAPRALYDRNYLTICWNLFKW